MIGAVVVVGASLLSTVTRLLITEVIYVFVFRSLRVLVVICSVLATLAGCATLFNEKQPSIGIESDPDGADVYVDGNYVGTTPVSIKLSVRNKYTIVFRKAGYEDHTYELSNFVGTGWIVLGVLGGLIPIIVDAATGDWYELSEENINVALERQQS